MLKVRHVWCNSYELLAVNWYSFAVNWLSVTSYILSPPQVENMSQDVHSNKRKEDTIVEAQRAREERQNVKARQSAAITIQVV